MGEEVAKVLALSLLWEYVVPEGSFDYDLLPNPAKEFTAAEREASKFAYSRRKIFWDVISGFVRAGFTSDVAIDKVYAAYGRQLPVPKVLIALRRDKRQGGHPSLRL
ncbi:hypothetical protein F442_04960 [Phytophthora nicotianae P10297]|uniref:Uncharacterized protein n=1 Tax=Phytophthora nicotianae P10297 TaxID=1317064 RepID=W2ZQB0_PHYNI|nr:hypothetical protein F442_04960 [Phytophthora nicotianae P10297]